MEGQFFIQDNIKNKYFTSKQNGFSLIEVLVALALFSILIAMITVFFERFQRGATSQQVTSDVMQKARSGLNFMSEEMKLAGADPAESGNFDVVTATNSTFTFDFDVADPDPLADPRFDGQLNKDPLKAAERITYRFINGTLQRILNWNLITTPPPVFETVLDNVDTGNSRFVYVDEDGNQLPDANGDGAVDNPDDIRSILVTLTVRESAGRDGFISRTFTSRVMCRNLTFNAQRK